LSDGVNRETHEQSKSRYKDDCGHPTLGQKVVPHSSLLLEALWQDKESHFIEYEERKPQGVVLPPVELHLRHRANDVAASHQAVAWEHQEYRQCGVSLSPLGAEHYYALSIEENERQETAECL
jgi:hypothetical protein